MTWRILIAEDEALVAMDLALEVEEARAIAVGPAASCAEALALIARERIDGAILDIQLADGDVTPAAEALLELGAVVLLHTASPTPQELAGRLDELDIIPKPADPRAVVRRLIARLEGRRYRRERPGNRRENGARL
ncbi:MAG TPA: hypothetical protein VGS12_16410 [Caulobacteraceae bacterium]|nr:hypothetical protein [Caulobacteraceae bacterium]